MQVEPHDAERPGQETLHLSREERAALIAEVVARQAANFTCPACGLRNPSGQLVCLRCESDVIAREITVNVGLGQAPPRDEKRTIGDVLIAPDKSMALEIGSAVLQLPVTAILTLGRHATPRDDNTPHVDLSPYGAWEHGVSRNHVEIRRRNKLLYIVDLGSTNGSALNGRRLYPGAEKLLRSGDKLQLSRMTLTVKF
jgi:hypothetical protein